MIDGLSSYFTTTNAVIVLSVIVGTALTVKVAKIALPVLKQLGDKFYYSKFATRLIIPFNSNSVNKLYLERNSKTGDAINLPVFNLTQSPN